MESLQWRVWPWALGVMACAALGCDKPVVGSGAGSTTARAHVLVALEWRVGVYLSLTGEDATVGRDTKDGIDLAFDELNGEGGVKQRQLRTIVEDDHSDATDASAAVLKLVDREKVVALLGSCASTRSRAGGYVATRRRVPMIAPMSTNPDVTRVGPFVFRATFADDTQGQVGAAFVLDTLQRRRVAVLYASDDLYSSGLAKAFREELRRRGGEVVLDRGFPLAEARFDGHVAAVKQARADAVYAPLRDAALIPLLREAKAGGLALGSFVGGDGWDSVALLTALGADLEGAHFTGHYVPDLPGPAAKRFLTAFRARFGRAPSSASAMGYEAARLLADAIARSTSDDPEALRDALQRTKGYAGIAGPVSIDAERNAARPVVIAQIKGQSLAFRAALTAGSPPPAPSAPPR